MFLQLPPWCDIQLNAFFAARTQANITAIVQVAFLAHWGACLFRQVGATEREEGLPNWLDATDNADRPLIEQYFASLQWSVSALKAAETTSGTLSEYMASVFVMIAGAALLANVISSGGCCCSIFFLFCSRCVCTAY
jgi:hypothetical protein